MRAKLVIAIAAAAVLVVACTSGGSGAPTTQASVSIDTTPVTLSFWSDFSPGGDTEAQLQHVFDTFHAQYPWITVKPVGNKDDQAIVAAINGGVPPDVALSFSPDHIGKFCSSGAFNDLQPYIDASNVDMTQFPPSTQTYTQFDGIQCSLPMLADAYGLYYNTDLFAAAGISEPPATITQLTADTKALTEFNPDGSIKRAGYIPWNGFYGEWGMAALAQSFGCPWFNEDGTSAVNSDCWQQAFAWQKEMVDFYGGPDNIVNFLSGLGDEWSPDNGFHTGQVAMMYDGEWRVDSIGDQAPKLSFATAPFPVADANSDQYGSGVIGGNLLGIPKGAAHPDDSWLLIHYLATDTPTLVYLVNNFKNLPTTNASLESPKLDLPDQFTPFFAIFADPNSSFPPITGSGNLYSDLTGTWNAKWQAGKVAAGDIGAALDELAQQIDEQSQLDTGP